MSQPTKVYRRRLDYASLALLLVSLSCLAVIVTLMVSKNTPLLYAPFLLAPSAISASLGLNHLIKTEAVIG